MDQWKSEDLPWRKEPLMYKIKKIGVLGKKFTETKSKKDKYNKVKHKR